MKLIISGTNRPGALTLEISKLVQSHYLELGEKVDLLDLGQLPMDFSLPQGFSGPFPEPLTRAVESVNRADGIIVVCPEYNGSYPGALKYFIDHWKFPDSFEFRPVCFIGLGGRFGGLRPVEHLQQIFGYRNAFIFPLRVFLINVWQRMKQGKFVDAEIEGLLRVQAAEFRKFVAALQEAGLDANSRVMTKGQG